MNTILVPLDGSALAEQVLSYVRRLAPLLSAKVELLHAIADSEFPDQFTDAILPVSLSEARR